MADMFHRLASRIRNLVGVFHIRRTDDSGPQQRVQINTRPGGPRELEEVIDDVVRLGHYGIAYVPPEGSEAVVLFLDGLRSQGVVIATGHRESRPKDLEPGEMMVFNSLQDIWVRFCADGKIRSKGEWLHDGHFKATGDVLDHSADNAATMKVHRDAYNGHTHGGVQAGGANTLGPAPEAE
jgi:hypothetical protein